MSDQPPGGGPDRPEGYDGPFIELADDAKKYGDKLAVGGADDLPPMRYTKIVNEIVDPAARRDARRPGHELHRLRDAQREDDA